MTVYVGAKKGVKKAKKGKNKRFFEKSAKKA